MTEYRFKQGKLPPTSVFLSTVCPGVPFLDDNTFFSVRSLLDEAKVLSIEQYNWPFAGLVVSQAVLASLVDTYLNVARPPYQHDENKNAESSTYVPLPLHITSLFSQVAKDSDVPNGGTRHMQVGASVNPLVHDPFRLVLLNPGCLSTMVRLPHDTKPPSPPVGGVCDPLNKIATGLNRLLRLGAQDLPKSCLTFRLVFSNGEPGKLAKDSPFSAILEYDANTYVAQMSSPAVHKLLVSVNVNVLNVFALDENSDYNNTATVVSTAPLFPQSTQPAANLPPSSSASVVLSYTQIPLYKKVVERPILRLQLKPSLIATSMVALAAEPSIVLGLGTGEIVVIKLADLTYRHFSDLGADAASNDQVTRAIPDAVSALNAIVHPTLDLLLVAGFASGEVMFIDPTAPASASSLPYRKTVVGKDKFVTYFKKFDLSFLAGRKPAASDNTPPYIVGHFKLSHKPITSFASTIAHNARIQFPNNPMVLAVASDDGLVRFVDLIATHGQNYGDPSKYYHGLIVTDIVSSYFQDGVRFVEFSPDFRFLCVCGQGDAIEMFKVSYYNVNGLLLKNADPTRRMPRSRSNTINSLSSNGHVPALFSAPASCSASPTAEMSRKDPPETRYPPAVKDIVNVCRFKAHTNTVERVAFVKADEFYQKSSVGHDAYHFVSCGRDGNVMLWELNTKVVAKPRKTHMINARGATRPERNAAVGAEGEQNNIVMSLYRSLHELRLKKQNGKLDIKLKYQCIIHGVVDDTALPIMRIPLLAMDLLCLIREGSIGGFHLAWNDFWVFGNAGDIFRYRI
ncbi:hypothetical protein METBISCDRAFT_9892, partial [Metschnikowia bicuspidata]